MPSETELATYRKTHSQLNSTCHELACNFLTGDTSLLLRHSTDELTAATIGSLQGIILKAADIAIKIWTQPYFLTSKGLPGLPAFEVSSPTMEAHRLHRLDDEDQSMDGRLIKVVTQPALIIHGNSDGKDYNTSRVLVKAVVCL